MYALRLITELYREGVSMDSKQIKELYKKANPVEQGVEKLPEQQTFSLIRQGTATNALTKIRASNAIVTENKIKKTTTLTQGDASLTLPSLLVDGLKTSSYQLLDALTVVFTETGAKSPTILMALNDYMKKRGITNKKEARKQVTADLEELYEASIGFTQKRGKAEPLDFKDMRLISSKGINRGIIEVTLSTDFYHVLLGYQVMNYPAQLWTLDNRHNPNSYYFLRKISEHKNMNVGKKNEDIIAVKTLLAVAPNIPTYEKVMSGDRAVNRRIIDPFERDMNALEDTLEWEYCHPNGEPLADEELNNFSYETFIALLIKVNWNTYPDQTARLERKEERIEANKKKKEQLDKEIAKAKAKKIVDEAGH